MPFKSQRRPTVKCGKYFGIGYFPKTSQAFSDISGRPNISGYAPESSEGFCCLLPSCVPLESSLDLPHSFGLKPLCISCH